MKHSAQVIVLHPKTDETQASSEEAAFKLTGIDNFDARGLKRCSVGGCGSYFGRRKATADFWRDRTGDVVIRLCTTHQEHSYRCRLKSGAPVPESMLPVMEEYVADLLEEWSADCLDEPPWIEEN